MGVGIITAIIVGGFAGWIAEKIMKSDMSLFANIGLGIIGSFFGSLVFGLLGVSFAGVLGYLVSGVLGACLLILIARQMKKS